MINHMFTAESVLSALPQVLQEDSVTLGLATTIATELNNIVCNASLIGIYANIDKMDETLLDILAKDFKINWWRPNASIDEKRYTIKTNWYVHRHLGTKSAIQTAVANFLGKGNVEEWYEYGGEPHHFRIMDTDNKRISENLRDFLNVLSCVQRGSSVLDKITAKIQETQQLYVGLAMRIGKKTIVDASLPPSYSEALFADTDVTILVNEAGDILCDAEGNILTE